MAPHLIPGGLTNIQYVDYTVIIMDCDDTTTTNVKFLLYCFELMSSLKINYHKSEVLVFGVSENEQNRIADMLNCRVGSMPMNYLGILISDRTWGSMHLEG